MRRWSALLLLFPLALPATETTTDFTVERLWDMARLGPFAVAPDGRTVAVTTTTFDVESDQGTSRIWLFDLDGRRAVRELGTSPGSDTRPAWHPDGRQLFFLGTRKDKPAQLYGVPLQGGAAKALTDLPTAVTSYRVVEGGRAIIFEASTWPDLNGDFAKVRARIEERKADKTQARISETRLLRYWDHYLTDGRVPHLFRLDVDSGAIADLMPGFDRLTGLDGFEWDASSDGRQLVYSANATNAPYHELNFDLFLRRVNGEERNLTADNPADDIRPVFSPDASRVAYGRYARPAIASDFSRLSLLDIDTGDVQPITPDFAGNVSDWRFDASGERLTFHGERHGRTHLYRWRDGRVRRLVQGGVTEAAQPAGQGVLYARQDFSHPADLWLLEGPGSEPRRITALNDERLARLRFGRYRSVDYSTTDGAAVQMFVAYPPRYRRGGRYPAVILNHGGPFAAWTDAFSFRWHPGLLAARGYVVALPNFRGSTGFGQAFADSILGNHGEKPVMDTLAAADWLVAHAGVDPERLAIAGGSYGGYLAALLTGMDQRFKAAIVHAGVYDIGQQFASDAHWSRPSAYGDAPWTDPTRLNAWSPSQRVPAMTTPTLILHGEMDYRVPVTQGINLHGALSGKGVPSRIVVFPQEHHWIVRPQAARLWWSEVFAWLDRWLPANASRSNREPDREPMP